jgi:hypothetical protein
MEGALGNEGALPPFSPQLGRCFPPDDIFVISPIDESVDLSVFGMAKQDATLDSLAKEDLRSLRQELFAFTFSLDE